MRKVLQSEWLLPLALSNTFFIRSWESFLYPHNRYLSHAPDFLGGLGTLWIAILLLATALWVVRRIADRSGNTKAIALSYFLLLMMLVPPLNQLRTLNNLPIRYHYLAYTVWTSMLGETLLRAVLLALAAVAAYFFVRHRTTMIPVTKRIGNALAVFLALTTVQSAWSLVRAVNVRGEFTGTAPSTSSSDKPRIVILLFDEMSERLIAAETRGKVALPALDKFRSETVYGTNVSSPAGLTMLSVPAYLSGTLSKDASTHDKHDIHESFFSESEMQRLQSGRSFFLSARQAGLRTTAIGYYVPYCRGYGAHLDRCFDTDSFYDYTVSMPENVAGLFRRSMTINPMWAKHEYSRINDAALRSISNPDYQLNFIHWPLPHLPTIFEPATGRIVRTLDNSADGYRANLLLVDKTFAAVRERLERSGQWDKSTVIVLSDHGVHNGRCWSEANAPGWRDVRVPFLVKMPHQRTGIPYKKSFNAILLRELVESVLDGSVREPEQLVRWLDTVGQPLPRLEPAMATCESRTNSENVILTGN